MFYPPFGTKQVEIFLFIKRKSAISTPKIEVALFSFLNNFFTGGLYNVFISLLLSALDTTI